MIKILFTMLLICFLKQAKAYQELFLVKSDTLNSYPFLNSHKQLLGKKVQKNKSFRFCPICHRNTDVIPVLYGYPSYEMIHQYSRGEIILGGCIPDKKRTDYCKKDKHYF